MTDPTSNLWINGKKIGRVSGVDIWEYEFGGLGMSRVVARGIETNNPKLQTASSEYGVFIDGKKVELTQFQYSDLFGQMGYLYAVVQPAKLKQRTQNR